MVAGNVEMEKYQTQMGVLLKGTDSFAVGVGRAKTRMAELAKFAAETPMTLPEIVQAEKVMLGFGESTTKALAAAKTDLSGWRTMIGDVAAGTGQSFGEIAGYFGRLSSGATGEFFQRMTELGVVTRSSLKEMGIQFSKSKGNKGCRRFRS